MSRLYYEKESPILLDGNLNDPPPRENPAKAYFEKLASLIPAEIIAGYIAMTSLVPLIEFNVNLLIVYGIIFLLCLVLTPIYFNFQAEKDKPKRNHIIITTIAFVIWAYATSGAEVIPDYYSAAVSSIVIISFSLISGAIPLGKLPVKK